MIWISSKSVLAEMQLPGRRVSSYCTLRTCITSLVFLPKMCNLHFKTMMKHQTYPHGGTFYKRNGLYSSKMVMPWITKNQQPFRIKMSKNATFMILNFLLLFRILSEQLITPLYQVCRLFQCYFILKTILWICGLSRLHSGKESTC